MTQQIAQTLLAAGFATQSMIDRAVRSRVAHGGSLASHLVLHGVLPDLSVALWFARRYHLPLATETDLNNVSDELARLLPEEIVYEAGLLPLRRATERSLIVGWVDPTEPGRVEEAEFFAGYAIEPHVLTTVQMASAYERLLHRTWKVPSADLLAAQRLLNPADFPADRLFDWLDLLLTLESGVEPFLLDPASAANPAAAGGRPNEPVYELTPDLRRNAHSLRVTNSENSVEVALDRDGSQEISLRRFHTTSEPVAFAAAPRQVVSLAGAASDADYSRTTVMPAIGRPRVADSGASMGRSVDELVPIIDLVLEPVDVHGVPLSGDADSEADSDFDDAPLIQLDEVPEDSVIELRPELIRSPGTIPGMQAPAIPGAPQTAPSQALVTPPPAQPAQPSGATRRLVLDIELPVPQPPLRTEAPREQDDAVNASLTTGMFRAPTPEQIENEQARRRLQHLPHYRGAERSGSLQAIPTDTDSHQAVDGDYNPSNFSPLEGAPGRSRHVTPTPTYTSASLGGSAPLPVSSGTFHQLPARIFDASGPAQGPVRAAFRSAIKGLSVCGSREAIAREIVESLGIVFANVMLLHPRMPQLQVWDASLRRGSPRLIGAEIEMAEGGFWQRIRAEQLTFRGALLPDDPLRQLLGRELGNDSLIVPLNMNRRTVAILVLDNGRDQALPSFGGLFKGFDEAVTGAFRRMIMTNKRPQWQPN